MGVHHAVGIVAHGVDGAVDGEARRVDIEVTVIEFVAGLVHAYQAGSGDLVEHHAVGIDQEVMLVAGDAGRQVGKDQVVPAVQGDQPVGGGQIHTQLPFFCADGVFLGLDGIRGQCCLAVHGSALPCFSFLQCRGKDHIRGKGKAIVRRGWPERWR